MDKNLEALEKMLDLMDTKSTVDEVLSAFEIMLKVVKDIQEENESDRDNLKVYADSVMQKTIDRLDQINSDEWSKIKQKVGELSNGKDGKEGPVGPKGDSIVGPMGPEGPAGKDAEVDPEEFAILATEYLKTLEKEEGIPMSAIKDLEDTIATLQNRTQLLVQIATQRENASSNNSSGGGHVIEEEGTPLTQRANLNFVGDGVTVTDAGGKTVVTIPGAVGGSGITRSVNSVAVPTSAGATGATDYVYLVSGTTTITLPTAVGNTNLYTVKNVGADTVTVDTTGGQTIDGSVSVSMPVANQSLDFISDNSSWNIV